MRFIDRTGCQRISERGKSMEIESLGKLTRKACRIAKENRLGVLKNSRGQYRVIRESGLGAYEDFFENLEEVDDFLKHLDSHKATKY